MGADTIEINLVEKILMFKDKNSIYKRFRSKTSFGKFLGNQYCPGAGDKHFYAKGGGRQIFYVGCDGDADDDGDDDGDGKDDVDVHEKEDVSNEILELVQFQSFMI